VAEPPRTHAYKQHQRSTQLSLKLFVYRRSADIQMGTEPTSLRSDLVRFGQSSSSVRTG